MSAPRVGVARVRNGQVEVSYHRLRGALNPSSRRYDLGADTNQPTQAFPDVDRSQPVVDFYPGPLPQVLPPVVDEALCDDTAGGES